MPLALYIPLVLRIPLDLHINFVLCVTFAPYTSSAPPVSFTLYVPKTDFPHVFILTPHPHLPSMHPAHGPGSCGEQKQIDFILSC